MSGNVTGNVSGSGGAAAAPGAQRDPPTIGRALEPSEALFALERVSQERGGKRTLDGISLTLPPGEIVALVGPSGAGKTSLLRLLNRLDDPSAGSIAFAGAPITSYPVRALRQRVGFVFQQPTMFPGTVADNLRAGLELAAPAARRTAADPELATTLAAVGLDASYLGRDAAVLSGGEQQRVSIARALTTGPEVLLLDEPTSALDPEVAEHLMRTIARLRDEQRLTIVMVTHRLAEARATSTVTVMLERGRVVEVGPTARLFGAPAQARTRAFLLGEA